MRDKKRVLVVGLGHMGTSHALAYARIDGFEVAGLCTRGIRTRAVPVEVAGAPRFTSFDDALGAVKPDVVSINTMPDTHAAYAIKAMEAGAHRFPEKAIAEPVPDAGRVVAPPARTKREPGLAYILPHPPSWM